MMIEVHDELSKKRAKLLKKDGLEYQINLDYFINLLSGKEFKTTFDYKDKFSSKFCSTNLLL